MSSLSGFDLAGRDRCILPERPQFADYESIHPNDCESILTKGYQSILWMVSRPAVSAAGYQHLLNKQPDTFVHHGELRYGTMGLIDFSFSASEEREIVSDVNEKSSYIKLYEVPAEHHHPSPLHRVNTWYGFSTSWL